MHQAQNKTLLYMLFDISIHMIHIPIFQKSEGHFFDNSVHQISSEEGVKYIQFLINGLLSMDVYRQI